MKYSLIDQLCLNIDQTLRAVFNNPHTSGRPYPAVESETPLDASQAKQSARLMRINHSGEVCAQALYHGQRIASQSPDIKNAMQKAMIEEGDHLFWCKERLSELHSHTSYLNPIWYAGSFSIGLIAGLIGDRWSLGFLAETEQQVIKHLEQHVSLLEDHDARSSSILKQMQEDEARHRDHAIDAGAHALPLVIKKIMAMTSKLMVKTTYWI